MPATPSTPTASSFTFDQAAYLPHLLLRYRVALELAGASGATPQLPLSRLPGPDSPVALGEKYPRAQRLAAPVLHPPAP